MQPVNKLPVVPFTGSYYLCLADSQFSDFSLGKLHCKVHQRMAENFQVEETTVIDMSCTFYFRCAFPAFSSAPMTFFDLLVYVQS